MKSRMVGSIAALYLMDGDYLLLHSQRDHPYYYGLWHENYGVVLWNEHTLLPRIQLHLHHYMTVPLGSIDVEDAEAW